MDTHATSPLDTPTLKHIVDNACETAIGAAELYNHASVAGWNTEIINTILKSLIDKTSDNEHKSPQYKYVVSSAIIQHIGSLAEAAKAGRRGMHSAVGAYWNNEKDGTWSYKWEGAEKRGMDIVISVTWIGI